MIGQDRNIALAIKGSSGYSLVEFLIAMLILALVSLSWLTIAQVQSANRESYRREAVERLVGMMDVVSLKKTSSSDFKSNKNIAWRFDDGQPNNADVKAVHPLFGSDESSIGYRIRAMYAAKPNKSWQAITAEDEDLISLGTEETGKEADMLVNKSPVLVGELFERSGTMGAEVYTNDEKRNVGERIWRVAVVLGPS